MGAAEAELVHREGQAPGTPPAAHSAPETRVLHTASSRSRSHPGRQAKGSEKSCEKSSEDV